MHIFKNWKIFERNRGGGEEEECTGASCVRVGEGGWRRVNHFSLLALEPDNYRSVCWMDSPSLPPHAAEFHSQDRWLWRRRKKERKGPESSSPPPPPISLSCMEERGAESILISLLRFSRVVCPSLWLKANLYRLKQRAGFEQTEQGSAGVSVCETGTGSILSSGTPNSARPFMKVKSGRHRLQCQ